MRRRRSAYDERATVSSPIQATANAPLGRLAAPQEIVDVVLFLASPRAAYVSGAVLSVDGASSPMVV